MGQIHFAIAGWSYPDWEGIFYPGGMPKPDQLAFVARYFDGAELNNTFYRIPASKMVEGWVKRVGSNPRFQFTAKLFQGFTHEDRPIDEAEVKLFSESMNPLLEADRLGALLLQFPFSFSNSEANRARLVELADRFRHFKPVVEFRNRNWIVPETFELLTEHQIGFCNVDEPVFRSMIKPSSIVIGPIAYLRFHGRNYENWFKEDADRNSRYDYLYSEEELDQWIPRIREMGDKAENVYVVGNNHFRGQAPANILQLKSKTIQEPVEVPQPLLKAYPQLAPHAKQGRDGQQELW